MEQAWRRGGAAVTLTTVLATGCALRLVKLDASLWLDEILTYRRARGTLGYAVSNLLTPLHEVLANLSLRIADNEAFLRLPSLLAGLCAIIVIYFVARSVSGKVAGCVAALLLAVSAYHIHHSQWARYYGLMMLAGLLWAWLLHRCVAKGGAANWMLYILTCLWGLLIHPFCTPFLASMCAGAAVATLASRTTLTFRDKGVKLALLALCTLLGSTGILTASFTQAKTPLNLFAADQPILEHASTDTANAHTATSREKPMEKYRLTVREYLGFLRKMFLFQGGTGRGWCLYLFFGVVGLFVVFGSAPSFGWITLSAFCLTPLPLLVVPVTLPYAHRYFSVLLPIGLVLTAVGIVRAALFAAMFLTDPPWRERSPGEPSRTGRVTRLTPFLVIPFLAAFAPTVTQSLSGYYRWHPAWDWKNMATYMSYTMTPNDVLYWIDPSKSQFDMTVNEFYLKRLLKHSEGALFSMKQFREGLDEAALRKVAADHPQSTIWFCAMAGDKRPEEEILDRVCDTQRDFRGIRLWALGEPTANLIRGGGGFEGPVEAKEGANVQLVGPEEAYSGARAIRMRLAQSGNEGFGFRINTPGYTYNCLERNAGFEVWYGGKPVGWNVSMKAASAVRRAAEGHSGRAALELAEAAEAVIVQQSIATGLAPGNVVEVKAFGKADAEKQLALALTYEVFGQLQRRTAYHPGGGAWAPLVVRDRVPLDATPESLTVELRREPGIPGTVLVDDAEAVVQGVTESLDPLKTYTLSLVVRYEGLRSSYENTNTWDAASVVVSFHKPDGKDEELHLTRFYGNSEWRYLAFQLKPGRHIPLGASWLLVSFALCGSGTIWIDNVQLEPHDHPTPFAEGVRLPHDELLAGADFVQTAAP